MFILLSAAFLLSVAGVDLVRRYALANRIIDMPNHRSSHIEPAPRGAGLAIIVVFLTFSFVLLLWRTPSELPLVAAAVIALTATAVAGVGWFDDHRSLSPLLRIAIHLLAAFLCVAYFGVPEVPFFGVSIDLGWFGWPAAMLAMVWCANFFNFMDGIDGIAAIEAGTMAIGAWIVLSVVTPEHDLSIYLWLLVAVVAGFLLWNWSPARVFMGDAGSSFLGFLLAQFALLTSGDGASGVLNVWCWLILFGVFFVDATVTLALRVIAGEKLSQAHCHHAYQRLARALQQAESTVLSPLQARVNAHRAVSLAVAAVNLFWLTPLALVAVLLPAWGVLWAAIALTPLIVAVLFTVRHTARE